jgi:hypothetical protein
MEERVMRKLFILLAAVVFVVGATVPALANDWAFYGRAHMDTYWVDQDKEAISSTAKFDDSDLDWSLDSTTYIGAKVATDYGIGGRFEYGTSSTADIRLLFGTWNFGAGTLLVGQDYCPSFFGCGECNQTPTFLSHGLYTGRRPQIKVTMGGLQLAAIENGAGGSTELDDATGTALTFGDTDVSLPKLEAKYSMNVGPAALNVVGGYQTFDNVDQTGAAEKEYSVDSWVVGLGASVGFGPATIRGNVSMSQNPSNYGLGYLEKLYPRLSASNQVLDVDGMGWLIDVGYAVSDNLRVDFGYGQGKLEIDEAGVKEEDTFGTYHIFACFTLAKGMCLQPEYSVKDYDECKDGTTTTDEGKKTYIGLRWKIDW